MPTAPAALSPARAQPLHAHDESTLAALLDLFEDDGEPASPVPVTAARRAGGRLRAWATRCRRRAARWGMGPGGSRRAW